MPMPKPVCRTDLYNKIVQLEVCRTFSGRGMGINGTAQSNGSSAIVSSECLISDPCVNDHHKLSASTTIIAKTTKPQSRRCCILMRSVSIISIFEFST